MNAAPPSRTASRVLRITWPFVAIVAFLLALAGASLYAMSAVRAYVGGESLWSKAQKTAVRHLGRYARTHDESDFAAYHAAVIVIFGDRDARLALEQPQVDVERARKGLIAGRNDPADVDGMIALFRYFRRVPFMARAVQFWTEGDALVGELDQVAS